MATNKFPGTCTRCGNTVPAGEGTLKRGYKSWEVEHQAGTCEQVELVRIYDFSPETYFGGVVFYNGKPVVVVHTERMRSQDDEDEWETIGIARPATEEEVAAYEAERDRIATCNRSKSLVVSLIEEAEEASVPEDAERIGFVQQVGFWEPVTFYADAERIYASYSRYDNDHFGSRVTALARTPELEDAVGVVCGKAS